MALAVAVVDGVGGCWVLGVGGVDEGVGGRCWAMMVVVG